MSNDTVYVGYTYVSNDGLITEHGFVQAFQAKDLSVRRASWESSPTTPHGGVWQAGRGLAADAAGNLIVVTADGEWNGTTDYGNSVVKLAPSTLAVKSWFTPVNWYSLFVGDIDLGANGVTLIPHSDLAFTGGKQGVVYLMKQSNLGGLQMGNEPLQSMQASNGCGYTQCGQSLSTAFWDHDRNPYLFVWDKQDYLRAYPFDAASQRFETADSTVGSVLSAGNGGIVVTSNGSKANSGIIWAYTSALDPLITTVPGTLRAYDATNITHEIYNSDQSFGRDSAGSFVKFLSPMVANGRVYLGTQSNSLEVYGLLCQTDRTSDLAVVRGPLQSAPKSTRSSQQITFTNNSPDSIGGPFSVVFDALPSGVTVLDPAGKTSCVAPSGSPWIAAPDAPLWLEPGQSFSVEVTLIQTGKAAVTYTPVILAEAADNDQAPGLPQPPPPGVSMRSVSPG